MSTTVKALTLLPLFTEEMPEIGLSQICRLASRDKATTYRHLQALESVGFVEQNPVTKHYRLGPAFIHLAQVREATVPRENGARDTIKTLAEATGETAHVTVLSGTTVYGLCAYESPAHSIRAIIDTHIFPLHATASGLCALAYANDDLIDVALSQLDAFTAATPTTPQTLKATIAEVKKTGFGHAHQTYETGIEGVAAPVFDHTGGFAGAVAVACVASRFTKARAETIKSELIAAAKQITRNWGGVVPKSIEQNWANAINHTNLMETET